MEIKKELFEMDKKELLKELETTINEDEKEKLFFVLGFIYNSKLEKSKIA